MNVKWRVVITTTVEVESDLSGLSLDKVINLAHGPAGIEKGQESEVTAVEIDGRWYEAPPF